jgi:hypothetical protein
VGERYRERLQKNLKDKTISGKFHGSLNIDKTMKEKMISLEAAKNNVYSCFTSIYGDILDEDGQKIFKIFLENELCK